MVLGNLTFDNIHGSQECARALREAVTVFGRADASVTAPTGMATVDRLVPVTICPTAPRRAYDITGLLEVSGSFLRILAVSDHEDERRT